MFADAITVVEDYAAVFRRKPEYGFRGAKMTKTDAGLR